MSWSSCPFCTLQVVSTELERHANTHFDDDDDDDLVSSSTPSQSQVEHGFMRLLKDCLECESSVKESTSTSTSILSGYTDHFQSIEFEDVGWGCGWRNIQMLASHLIAQRQDARDVLFGGAGFVPDIPSLQRWLEVAWGKGFDAAEGSNHFHQNIYGKRTWIGTTECAALFRSFGLRARIVDFSSSSIDTGSSSNTKSVNGHQLLANWVWSYFSDNSKSGVVVTEKTPLYFQHDGHSRTIVGIQMKSLPNGTKQFNLLILDPAHKTQVLESCLSKKVGWQRFIKRGVHTLKKMEYQLCYVDPGIATGAEMEKLKTLDSTRFEF